MYSNHVDFAAINASNPILTFCAEHGIELCRAGKSWQGRCPLHNERNGNSFTVWQEENRWWCFGQCGRGGDVCDLHAALTGMTLAEAARDLSSLGPPFSPKCVRPIICKRTANAKREPHILTQSEIDRMNTASQALASDEGLCRAIASERGWDWETIQLLALAGDLGWEDGRMLFGYSHGIKWRWTEKGKRVIKWLSGGPFGQCWRQSLLCAAHHRVVIPEGETDAISLICAGCESDNQTLVLGLPGATMLPIPEPFRGKNVIIFPDRDAAGSNCAERLTKLLKGIAKSVRTASWDSIAKREVDA